MRKFYFWNNRYKGSLGRYVKDCFSELKEAGNEVIWSTKPLPFSVYVAVLALFLRFSGPS